MNEKMNLKAAIALALKGDKACDRGQEFTVRGLHMIGRSFHAVETVEIDGKKKKNSVRNWETVAKVSKTRVALGSKLVEFFGSEDEAVEAFEAAVESSVAKWVGALGRPEPKKVEPVKVRRTKNVKTALEVFQGLSAAERKAFLALVKTVK